MNNVKQVSLTMKHSKGCIKMITEETPQWTWLQQWRVKGLNQEGSMDKKEDSPEDILVMPNSCTDIPDEAQDEHPTLEQFEEVAAQDFDEAMV